MNGPSKSTDLLLGELASLPNGERLGRLRDHGRADDLIFSLAEEVERLTFAEVSRALTMSEMLVALADELDVPRGRSRTRRARAQALAYAGRFEESLATCRAALAIAEAAAEPIEMARAQLAALHPLGELADYAEAVQMGEAAAKTFRAMGEELLAAKADINLGGIHQNRDDPHRALFHLDRAKQALGDHPMLTGFVENNRGEALLSLHDFLGAQGAFEAALAASEKAGATLAAAIAEGNLGDLAARRGSLPQAMFHFERARRRLESDAARSHLARLIAEHAEALESLGLPDDALQAYQDALPQLEAHKLAWEAARARAGMGRALLHLGKIEAAEEALRQAGVAFAALNHSVAKARVDLVLAEVEAARGDPRSAYARLQAAQDALCDQPADLAVLRLKRARIALELGCLADADADLEAGLRFADELGASPLTADLLHTRGRLRAAQAQPDAALADWRAAVRSVDRVRGALQAERFRRAYLRDRLAIYSDLTTALLNEQPPQLSEAFASVEAARSRSLLDAVQGAVDVSIPTSDDAGSQEAVLQRRVGILRTELSVLYSQLSDSGGARLAGWTQAVRQREKELQLLEPRLSATRLGSLWAPTCALDEVQAALPDDLTLIEYHALKDELAAFVISRDSCQVIRGLTTLSVIEQHNERLRFQLARALRPGSLDGPRRAALIADIRRELAALWDLLIRPLPASAIGRGRVAIVPHGVLHAMPFQALFDGESYLIDRVAVSYAASASLLVHSLHRTSKSQSRAPNDVLLVGVADAAAPLIENEARRLSQVMPNARTLLGGAATAARVIENCSTAGLIHLACHGRYSRRFPLASGLKLADRWLTVHDIYGLRLNADLLTLSGCETGRSAVEGGDELLGFASGFLAAGAGSLLVSQWHVNDAWTAEFMGGLYKSYYNGHPASVCWGSLLRDQQRAMKAACEHPLLWAPFMLVGKP